MKILQEVRSLIEDVREHGVVQLLDNSTSEIQTRLGRAWIALVVRATPLVCRAKDRQVAVQLHNLAGLYQTRPQEGWQAPPDWACWSDTWERN